MILVLHVINSNCLLSYTPPFTKIKLHALAKCSIKCSFHSTQEDTSLYDFHLLHSTRETTLYDPFPQLPFPLSSYNSLFHLSIILSFPLTFLYIIHHHLYQAPLLVHKSMPPSSSLSLHQIPPFPFLTKGHNSVCPPPF